MPLASICSTPVTDTAREVGYSLSVTGSVTGHHTMGIRAMKSLDPPRTLIVISCSARKKRSPPPPIPAITRYDGVLFTVIRKAVREKRMRPNTTVIIISAKYGVVRAGTKIPFYDQRLTASQATTLAPRVRSTLAAIVRKGKYQRKFVNLGRDYASMIQDLPALRGAVWASGSIGQRAAVLKSWITKAI